MLIDYGGFNMKVAAVAAAAGVPVLYYITPQVWASRAGALTELARTVTRAAVILPFEEKLLRDNGIDATFVGHPLLDRALTLPDRAAARATLGVGPSDRLLALFPGSRAQEIARHLDPFVETARELQRRDPALKVIVSAAPHVTIPADALSVSARARGVVLAAARRRRGDVQERHDDARGGGGALSARRRVSHEPHRPTRQRDGSCTIPYIGLVNVVAGREVAREFVQDALEPRARADALEPLLDREQPAARRDDRRAGEGSRDARRGRVRRRAWRRSRWSSRAGGRARVGSAADERSACAGRCASAVR